MKSIKAELFRVFATVIVVLVAVSVGFLIMHVYVVDKYKALSETTVQEYQLLAVAASLTDAYNIRYLSDDVHTDDANKQLKEATASTQQITAYLDTAIVDTQSKANYVGLKNTLATLLQSVNESLVNLSKHNITDYTADHDKIAQEAAYVKDNATILIFSQLTYTAATRAGLNKTYQLSVAAGIVVLALASLFWVIYAFRFSLKLSVPLTQLTGVARRITQGALETTIEPRLMERRDEIGSLASSFNVMLGNLKDTISKLGIEKASVERKVEERTADLLHEKARLSASVQSLSLGFITTDLNHEIILMNDAAKAILSYETTSEGVSKPRADMAGHIWTIDEIDERFKSTFKFRPSLQTELKQRHAIESNDVAYNGRILRILITPILDMAGSETVALGSVILLEDVTEAKVMERSRDEFFSIASHELRTPLTAIRGNSDMIRQYFPEHMKDVSLAEMVEDIHGSSIRLIRIVNDFLDVSRLEQDKFALRPAVFEMDKVIEGVVYEMSTVINEKQDTIKVIKTLGTMPPVMADKDRVKQVIYNLVGNAVKYTDSGEIEVACSVEGKLLKVSVSDSGPGITEEGQRLLFHKFQQAADNILTRDTSRSTGLGLYISKLLSEKMGGAVALERSKLGEGSTFSFTVPLAGKADILAAESTVVSTAAPKQPAAPRKKKRPLS
jgi:signal transduction histidine kinase